MFSVVEMQPSSVHCEQNDSTASILLSLKSMKSVVGGRPPGTNYSMESPIEIDESFPEQTPLLGPIEALLSLKSMSPKKRKSSIELPTIKKIRFGGDSTILSSSRVYLNNPCCVFKHPLSSSLIVWHSEQHIQSRNDVMKYIFLILQKRSKSHSPNWVFKIADIAERLETILYFSASSYEEYSNISTLRARVKKIAVKEISMKPM